MSIPKKQEYLSDISAILRTHWPDNRTVNIVCHGHSVPAGYFATPMVDSLNAYPHLVQTGLKHRFPYAVLNTIVTAIGGEGSLSGAARFEKDVLRHKPDIITIDYGLNDRGAGLEKARDAWTSMITSGLESGAKIILLTPTLDKTQHPDYEGDDKALLGQHAEQIRQLADEYEVGLADSFQSCHTYITDNDLADVLSWQNHPNRTGHELVAREILRWFIAG